MLAKGQNSEGLYYSLNFGWNLQYQLFVLKVLFPFVLARWSSRGFMCVGSLFFHVHWETTADRESPGEGGAAVDVYVLTFIYI